MLALQGNTAPYLLYAEVRIAGIARKEGNPQAEAGMLKFSEPQEWSLMCAAEVRCGDRRGGGGVADESPLHRSL